MQSSPSQGNKPISQSPQTTNSPLAHPKILPLVRRDCQERSLTENFLQRSLILHSKTFKTIKSQLDSSLSITNKSKSKRDFVQILKRQDSLSKLSSLKIEDYFFENPYFLSNLRNMSSLASLTIGICGVPKLSDKLRITMQGVDTPMITLLKNVVHLKNLVHVSIRLDSWRYLKSQFKTRLFRNLLCLKKLKSLSLSFVSFSDSPKGGLETLIFYLSKMTQLCSLKLSFEQSLHSDRRSLLMNCLALALQKLTQLAEISLNFATRGEMIIQRSDFLNLFQSLQSLKKLSGLSLNLSGVCLDNEILEDCLLCLNSSSIQKLDIDFYMKIGFKGLPKISKALQRFTSLRKLRLNFFDCEYVTETGISELRKALSGFVSLSSLCLTFPSQPQTKSIVENVASGLRTLQNLQQLQLEFINEFSITTSQLRQLFDSLVGLKLLRSLGMDFSFNKSLNHHVLKSFSEALKELTALKTLSLNFMFNEKMTNLDVEDLSRAIGHLYGLSSLTLNFADAGEINEDAIENIALALRSLHSLWSVNLSLYRNLVGEEYDLSSLFSALGEIRNLQEIVLFISPSKANKQMVNELGKHKNLTYSWA